MKVDNKKIWALIKWVLFLIGIVILIYLIPTLDLLFRYNFNHGVVCSGFNYAPPHYCSFSDYAADNFLYIAPLTWAGILGFITAIPMTILSYFLYYLLNFSSLIALVLVLAVYIYFGKKIFKNS